LTLPTKFRKDLKVERGDYLAIYEVGEKILVIEKIKPSPLDEITLTLSKKLGKKGITAAGLARAIKEAREGLWDEIYKEEV
jgi:bifunctional DNA-binding transcriptional regulator/antitoxin component of YhaV-PrlF toxin-antitoxin module